MAPFGPGNSTLLFSPERWIASAMAVVLEAMFSMTATAPAETIVADFKREARLVLGLTVTFLTQLRVTTPQAAPAAPVATDGAIFHSSPSEGSSYARVIRKITHTAATHESAQSIVCDRGVVEASTTKTIIDRVDPLT
jgi:hypothetical protein